MDSSHLQSFIDSNQNYISIFKENNFKIIKNSKLNLILVKNYYDKPLSFTNDNDYWKMYCRGAIINTTTNKVVCLPPIKATEIKIDETIHHNDTTEYQSLIDGTMINLFYHQNQWIISTRSEIGGYNKWNNRKSFQQLFDECSTIDYDNLNTQYSYSFVMRHTENRNIAPIYQNELYLVEVYSYENNLIQRLPINLYPQNDFLLIDSTNQKDQLLNFFKDPQSTPYFCKGFTIKQGNKRFKYINPHFNYVKDLKMNHNNPSLTYIHLRQNGNLKHFLNYFPEYQHQFNQCRDTIHQLSNELYSIYKNVFIHKQTKKNEIPYHLKPLVYDIHKLYLENKKPTSWEDIKIYIHSLPPKKLLFALNYT